MAKNDSQHKSFDRREENQVRLDSDGEIIENSHNPDAPEDLGCFFGSVESIISVLSAPILKMETVLPGDMAGMMYLVGCGFFFSLHGLLIKLIHSRGVPVA